MATESTEFVDQLLEMARDAEIIPGIQMAISGYAVQRNEIFAELTDEEARKIVRLANSNMEGLNDLARKALGEDESEETETSVEVSAEVKHVGKVYDAELGEFVQIDPKRQQVAIALQQRMDMAVLITAVALQKIADNRYFIELGYSSFNEYADSALAFNRTQAKKYLAIGRRFSELLPDNFEEGQSTDLLGDGKGQLTSLGIEKLYELTKIEDADYSEVASSGVVKLSDGTELDLDELNKASVKEFKEQLGVHRRYNADLEAELDKVVKERDKALSEADKAKSDAESGIKYRDLYGGKSTEYDAIKSRLAIARSRVLDMNQALTPLVDVPADEFPALAAELRDLHATIHRGLKALREDNMLCFVEGNDHE